MRCYSWAGIAAILLGTVACSPAPEKAENSPAENAPQNAAGTPANKSAAPVGENAFHFPDRGTTRVVEELSEIQAMLKGHGSDVLVVNFWATWCVPCVEELPDFVRVSNEYPPGQVRVVGLSLDLVDSYKETVPPFLEKNQIPYPNLVLFVDQEEVINYFSQEWSGALPATFFFDKNGNKIGEIPEKTNYEDLKAKVEELLKSQKG